MKYSHLLKKQKDLAIKEFSPCLETFTKHLNHQLVKYYNTFFKPWPICCLTILTLTCLLIWLMTYQILWAHFVRTFKPSVDKFIAPNIITLVVSLLQPVSYLLHNIPLQTSLQIWQQPMYPDILLRTNLQKPQQIFHHIFHHRQLSTISVLCNLLM